MCKRLRRPLNVLQIRIDSRVEIHVTDSKEHWRREKGFEPPIRLRVCRVLRCLKPPSHLSGRLFAAV